MLQMCPRITAGVSAASHRSIRGPVKPSVRKHFPHARIYSSVQKRSERTGGPEISAVPCSISLLFPSTSALLSCPSALQVVRKQHPQRCCASDQDALHGKSISSGERERGQRLGRSIALARAAHHYFVPELEVSARS